MVPDPGCTRQWPRELIKITPVLELIQDNWWGSESNRPLKAPRWVQRAARLEPLGQINRPSSDTHGVPICSFRNLWPLSTLWFGVGIGIKRARGYNLFKHNPLGTVLRLLPILYFKKCCNTPVTTCTHLCAHPKSVFSDKFLPRGKRYQYFLKSIIHSMVFCQIVF